MEKPDDWVILDTETTGLGKTDEIIELAIIDGYGNVLLDTLVNPKKRKISEQAAAIHGIDKEMLKDAPRFPEVLPKIQAAIRGRDLLIYNAEYDIRLLSQTAGKYDFEKVDLGTSRGGCVMLSYSGFVGEPSLYHQGEYKWQKLPNAGHRALSDCQATLALIKEMASHKSARLLPSLKQEQKTQNKIYMYAVIAAIIFLIIYLLSNQN